MKHHYRKAIYLIGLLMWQSGSPVTAAEFRVDEVASGIFVVKGVHEQMSVRNLGAIANTGFIIGERSVAVVDPGGSPEAGRLLKQAIRKLTDLPVEFLVLTHFHPDHVAGAAAFEDTEHVIAHVHHARAMTQRAQFYVDRFFELLPGSVDQTFRSPTQTVAVGESMVIDLGGRTLMIEAYPLAHTDNDVSVHDEQTNTLWASDLIFAQRTPALDGNLKGWLDVSSTIQSRNYATAIPGHGSPGPIKDLLTEQLKYLRDLHSGISEFLDKGVPLSEVLERHEANAASDIHWKLFADQHATNLAKAYAELEWD